MLASHDQLSAYLSPEPLTQSPVYLRRMAQAGMSVPTYAYAANNPLRYADPTGREVREMDFGAVVIKQSLRMDPTAGYLLAWMESSDLI